MFDPVKFGMRLKRLREDKGITQRQAAEDLHISTTHLCKMEGGSSAPSIDLCVQIGIYFDVSLDYLISGSIRQQMAPKRAIQDVIHILSVLEQQLP